MTLATRVAVMREGRIVQLDTPKKIYAEPADLFVAGFIGSPSMNLVDGTVSGGVFRAEGIEVPVNLADRDGVVLGIRPEELEIAADASAPIRGKLYALELTGDSTLVTLRAGRTSVCARGHADYEAEIDAPCFLVPKVGARFHLFDRKSGERLDR
jgi:multiple sugar transport system ATP-binding protein